MKHSEPVRFEMRLDSFEVMEPFELRVGQFQFVFKNFEEDIKPRNTVREDDGVLLVVGHMRISYANRRKGVPYSFCRSASDLSL